MVIAPGSYPAFQKDKDHPFAGLTDAARVEDIDDFCGRLVVNARANRAALASRKSA